MMSILLSVGPWALLIAGLLAGGFHAFNHMAGSYFADQSWRALGWMILLLCCIYGLAAIAIAGAVALVCLLIGLLS